ncbi:EthD domain-containing protein [Haliea sp. E1-2-M8]|uniref:EthD domain-containing protein n=1 Tax=Haliea sp. E1-2-M8 TaxID=3064706 RepID=UPI00272034F1|nr:EthD domain-containing protein [Haliea sp. E1-2-M8]MDO8862281.1 EthD domain-containing protein [Haliea sp. E1-2-M8]
MFKAIFLLKRKPGTSFEEFKEYYESTHRKLGERALPTAKKYIRRFLTPYPEQETVERPETEFDVITEIWFEDKDAFESAVTALAAPNLQAEIVEDESRFMDRSKISLFTVEEFESTID